MGKQNKDPGGRAVSGVRLEPLDYWGLRVRIPLTAWMFVCCFCCVLCR